MSLAEFDAPRGAPAGAASVSSILRSVGTEIGELERVACRLQDTVGLLVERSGCREMRTIEDVQALDLIVQRLSGLGGFLHALAPALPPDWHADPAEAARAVTLSDLAGRLGGADPSRAGPFQADPDADGAGALDLF